MSIYTLEPRQTSVAPLEQFRSTVRAAITPTPTNSPITPAQAMLVAADVLAERAGGSAILSDLADRVTDAIAAWEDVVSDDVNDWLSSEPAISATVIVVN